MIIHPLPVMMLTTRNDITNISTFHGIIAMICHKLISFIQMTFIVTNESRCFMMHHQSYSFTPGIIIQHFYIKIRIRSNKVKDKISGTSSPTFPTFIPTFHQDLIHVMFGCKIDISFHILIIGSMTTVWLDLCIIVFTESHSKQLICIAP